MEHKLRLLLLFITMDLAIALAQPLIYFTEERMIDMSGDNWRMLATSHLNAFSSPPIPLAGGFPPQK
jgi:hypothetical protein